MTETITYSTPAGVGASGDLTFGAQSTMNARILRQRNITTAADGNETVTSIVVETETEIPLDSRVWLPGASTLDNNQAQRVVRSEWARTLDGSYALYIHYC